MATSPASPHGAPAAHQGRNRIECASCGAPALRWSGQCATCGEWNSLVESRRPVRSAGTKRGSGPYLRPLGGDARCGLEEPFWPGADRSRQAETTCSTGVAELDRVLGGGLVPGSVMLLGGEPGIGKSTLLLQIAGAMSVGSARVLYCSAEESAGQVRRRAARLGLAGSARSEPTTAVLGHGDVVASDRDPSRSTEARAGDLVSGHADTRLHAEARAGDLVSGHADTRFHAEARPQAEPDRHTGTSPQAEPDRHAGAGPHAGTSPQAEPDPYAGTSPQAEPDRHAEMRAEHEPEPAPVEPRLWLLQETDLAQMLDAAERVAPDLLVVDSIQTLSDVAASGATGSPPQVRACAERLVQYAKATGTTVVLAGHVTKDGALAGPRTLEHMVDTVVMMEGERHHALRTLAAVKHRFGPTGELGLLRMTEEGLAGVEDASMFLLADRAAGIAGDVIVPVLEGRRPLLVELQALTCLPHQKGPRRVPHGIDATRFALVVAVAQRNACAHLAVRDVYASVVGGIKVREPAADLALGLAIISADLDIPLPPTLVACGEVGLGGEVRQVPHIERRLGEAARMGFSAAIVPASAPEGPDGMELVRVHSLAEAAALVELAFGSNRRKMERRGAGGRNHG